MRIIECCGNRATRMTLALLALAAMGYSANGCKPQREQLPPDAATGDARCEQPISLEFAVQGTAEGEVWINYYIQNRMNRGVLISEKLELSLVVYNGGHRLEFSLHGAGDAPPTAYTLLDSPFLERTIAASPVNARRVRVPGLTLREMKVMWGLPPELTKDATIAGRIRGYLLDWDANAGDYFLTPIDVSTAAQPWDPLSRLFKVDYSDHSTPSRSTDPQI